ncbi:M23 family metallopeptidase [uncultured Thiocystis sp.]|jgi:hypothetical protein|uniref:M23 family metallopeptidase n=1 Tax=uncultured Thiocystis sp. TaxID=1202134 RepID=UPI0025E8174D|nr:M23 family metallopeptidase [uncultured Thiocystis sp.]
MYHHDRIKHVRGQAVVVLLAVLSFTLAGAGLGFWIAQYATPDAVADASYPVLDFAQTRPRTTAEDVSPPVDQEDVNVIAARLGEMQAELLRLNALGERLVRMSGLDPEEFDFDNPPPQGGPELGPVNDYTIKEIASELGGVAEMIQDRQRKLDVIGEVIVNKDLTARETPSSWPVRSGYITSRFGFRIHPTKNVRIFHEGVDIASPRGTPILAAADGVVTFSGRRNGYGQVIDIRHRDGLVTRYAHNHKNLVQEGQMVGQGQKIATVGSTGVATGPHLHFEVRKGGKAVNPMPYLGDTPARTLADKTDRSAG